MGDSDDSMTPTDPTAELRDKPLPRWSLVSQHRVIRKPGSGGNARDRRRWQRAAATRGHAQLLVLAWRTLGGNEAS